MKFLVYFFKKDKLIDQQLKPPYIPPNEKMISDKEIEKIAAMKKPVIDEILVKFIFFFFSNEFDKE